jgi:hypothetical protein
MKRTGPTILCLAFLAALIGNASAASPKQAQSTTPKQRLPSPAPAPSPPPSIELSSFVTANLDAIAGPLEQKVALPRAELAQLQASYKSRLAKASPSERKPLKAALTVCKALSRMMTTREQAMLSPTAVTGWPQRAAQYRDVINQLLKKEKAAEMAAAGGGVAH